MAAGYWLSVGQSVGKVFGGDGFYDKLLLSFDSDVVVIGRTAGRPRVRSSSRPCAILSGTRRLESLFTRGVALVIAVDGLTDIIVTAAAA